MSRGGVEVRAGGLDHPATIALLRLHFERMLAASPPGTCHFLDLDALAAPEVRFWTVWDGDTLLGCGAMKRVEGANGESYGEVKSMRTADTALRRGVASALLDTIIAHARDEGIARLNLETGSGGPFAAAEALYRRHGFEPCPPFGEYRETKFNQFWTRSIDG